MEAERLARAMAESSVAFSYYDADDRLLFWNAAYEDLNFRIRPLIEKGARFQDLLTEFVARNQVEIRGDVDAWVASRHEVRRSGATTIRRLTDGRVYLVQERPDDVGGTLGFWVEVTMLFRSGALRYGSSRDVLIDEQLLSDGDITALLNRMQTIQGNLELLAMKTGDEDSKAMIADALEAARDVSHRLSEE